MPKTPNYAAQFDEQPADESDDFKRVFGGVKVPKGLQPGSNELTALEWLRKSPTSLTIDVDLTEEEWHTLIASIETIKKRYQWYLGDAMVYGIDRKYGETDEQIQRVVELTGKAAPTLHEYYKTALLFEINERSENLDFEQHRVLAIEFSQDTPEHRAERLKWLHIAETEKLSGRKLKAQIATQPPAPVADNGEPPPPDSPTIDDEEEATDLILPVTSLDDAENLQSLNTLQKILKTGSYRNATYQEAVIIHRRIAVARRALSLLEAELPRLKRGK